MPCTCLTNCFTNPSNTTTLPQVALSLSAATAATAAFLLVASPPPATTQLASKLFAPATEVLMAKIQELRETNPSAQRTFTTFEKIKNVEGLKRLQVSRQVIAEKLSPIHR